MVTPTLRSYNGKVGPNEIGSGMGTLRRLTFRAALGTTESDRQTRKEILTDKTVLFSTNLNREFGMAEKMKRIWIARR